MTSRRVHVVVSGATLLSGGLTDCQDADDESCEGGVAAVGALSRNYTMGEPTVVLATVDRQSPFVQMHPLGWSVNRYILNTIMGWKVMVSAPSLLTQNSVDYDISQRDISDLQSRDLRLLLTNAFVPPENSWHHYVDAVHFDSETGLALIFIVSSGSLLSWPQIESSRGSLNYVARINRETGCTENNSVFDNYFNTTRSENNDQCWTSVVFYAGRPANYQAFVDAVSEFENPPGIIVDLEGSSPALPQRIGSKGVWSYSSRISTDSYYQITLTVEDNRSIESVEVVHEDIEIVPVELKDEKYRSDISRIWDLADEAALNDPVVGTSLAMPLHRAGEYRRCEAGECEMGNLFTDAARWFGQGDVAFVTSGGLRGNGWEAGDVRVSDIWSSLPFPNNLCTGTMSGISLFRLFNYSTSIATFEGQDTSDGGRLLQVSGMQVVYNTNLESSRLVSLSVWDEEQQNYLPVERLRLYNFVTDSFLCGGYDPYPMLLGSSLTFAGEKPGTIGDALHQDVVQSYLIQLGEAYNSTIQGRLTNNTGVTEALNLIQTEDSCDAGTYWKEERLSCLPCPTSERVTFLTEREEFDSESGSVSLLEGQVSLINSEIFSVAIAPNSIPSWVTLTDIETLDGSVSVGTTPFTVAVGERVGINFVVDSSGLEAGTALGTVSFSVLGGRSAPGCVGKDASFDVFVRVDPSPELNHLGSIRILGWVLTAVVALMSSALAFWVFRRRELRIVKTLQPIFLITICVGIFIMGLTIVPLSIDDEIVSTRGCDIACMATPWLLSIGFTITMSALFSKLWRINKLFLGRVRRMKVGEKDVIVPFAVLFTLNTIFLLVWTIVDPLKWERIEIDGERWNTFGACRPEDGTVTTIMLSLVTSINIGVFLLACFQAYRARNIGDEFSESKNLGVALLGWLQLLLVGFPVLFLINRDNPTASYFLEVGLVFGACTSMLLLLFGPVLWQLRFPHSLGGRVHRSGDNNSGASSRSNPTVVFSASEVGKVRISGVEDLSGDDVVSRLYETKREEASGSESARAAGNPGLSRDSSLSSIPRNGEGAIDAASSGAATNIATAPADEIVSGAAASDAAGNIATTAADETADDVDQPSADDSVADSQQESLDFLSEFDTDPPPKPVYSFEPEASIELGSDDGSFDENLLGEEDDEVNEMPLYHLSASYAPDPPLVAVPEDFSLRDFDASVSASEEFDFPLPLEEEEDLPPELLAALAGTLSGEDDENMVEPPPPENVHQTTRTSELKEKKRQLEQKKLLFI